jgi:hypothetical protein
LEKIGRKLINLLKKEELPLENGNDIIEKKSKLYTVLKILGL